VSATVEAAPDDWRRALLQSPGARWCNSAPDRIMIRGPLQTLPS